MEGRRAFGALGSTFARSESWLEATTYNHGLTSDMVNWKSRMLNISRMKNDEAVHAPLNDGVLVALTTVFERGDGQGRVSVSQLGA